MARKISNLSASYTRFYALFRIQVQDWVSLDIKKKRGSRINLDIHHSKVFSSEQGTFEWWISELMLDPLFFLISRLNNACSLL